MYADDVTLLAHISRPVLQLKPKQTTDSSCFHILLKEFTLSYTKSGAMQFHPEKKTKLQQANCFRRGLHFLAKLKVKLLKEEGSLTFST